jgi:hypothetical protein
MSPRLDPVKSSHGLMINEEDVSGVKYAPQPVTKHGIKERASENPTLSG